MKSPQTTEDKLKICKVDIDANPDIPGKFGIRGIPTLIVFKGGNAEATKVGALSKTQLTDFITGSDLKPLIHSGCGASAPRASLNI